jgi:nucleoid-associated protein YgaU
MYPTLYVVREGDTLSGIALHFYDNGTEPFWRRIYSANREVVGDNPDLIRPGECLRIPFPPTLPCQYVVKYGDTLSDIALQVYGDGTEPCWRTIYDANKDVIGADPYQVSSGKCLNIPVYDRAQQ